jgi:hypothetical protein
MNFETSKRQENLVQKKTAAPAESGKSLPPPTFQLKTAESAAAGPLAAKEQGSTTAAPAEQREQTREEQVSAELETYYQDFAGITVNVPNPDKKAAEKTIPRSVTPPYMINTPKHMKTAMANRKASKGVTQILANFDWGFAHGKASAADIQSFLQQCIDAKHTTNNTSAGLRAFLDTYGIGTDCSGFLSQGYNGLMDTMDIDHDKMVVNDTGSGSFRASNKDEFTKVAAPKDLKPGDALYLDNPKGIDHVRMVQSVTVNEKSVDFVTIESSGGHGPRKQHWRYGSLDSYKSLEVSADGVTYAASKEKHEFARYKALYPAPKATDAATTPTPQ